MQADSMAPPATQTLHIPRVGMLATVRNRRAIITGVEPYGAPVTHLVNLEYIDSDGAPDDTLLWEHERNATLLEPNALPRVAHEAPMAAAEFDALQRAARWTALTPFHSDDNPVQGAIAAPLFGAVQTEDFQLVPLLKALQMPRISLLLADDVGLGKTVEAGLILTELLLRRRIRRVLIMTPAALRTQWQQEMQDKFAITCEIIDRAETFATQKRLGFDANPWRAFPRIITSYYYLRQPDVLEQFMATTRQRSDVATLPWDLLIVDEAHNLMPAPFGDDSDLSKMLRLVSPFFEHKLFLTATPHNGHTRSFSGLLEQLDPVRFTQTSDFTDSDRRRIEQVVVRRLKREINRLDEEAQRPPRFSQRLTEPLELYFGPREHALAEAFAQFRRQVRRLIAQQPRSEQLAGAFAVEVLNKRLLSCPFAFADSWFRFQEGLARPDRAPTGELDAARRAVEEDLDDDSEAESRHRHAAHTAGAWLKPLAADLAHEIANLDAALRHLGLNPAADDPNVAGGPAATQADLIPAEDARFDRLMKLIHQRLGQAGQWRDDERLIIFTEYKTTLDYLLRRLRAAFHDADQRVIRALYGNMDGKDWEGVKQAFNDPANAVRLLVATDAASEGINLQETARYIFHFDIPWNPARLDQRNGRLDRHGQARDVTVFHFSSGEDADLRFLARVVAKVEQIREDLGSMGEVFDAAFERRFTYFEEDVEAILRDLDDGLNRRRGGADIPREENADAGVAEQHALNWLRAELDLSPITLRDTLEQALGLDSGLPRFELLADGARVRLINPAQLARWRTLIDDTLRGEQGVLPALAFDPGFFVDSRSGRPVFRPRRDTRLLHLGHPIFQRALALFARARFPGSADYLAPSRWTVRYGALPAGIDALLLLTVEELATNLLRETFHHWLRTLRLPIIGDALGQPLPHLPALHDRPVGPAVTPRADIELAQLYWDEVEDDARAFLQEYGRRLTAAIQGQLLRQAQIALQDERERFRHRIREVERAINDTSLQRLERELLRLEAAQTELKRQRALFEPIQAQREAAGRVLAQRRRDLEDELQRRRAHYQALLDQLALEQNRVVRDLLPQRYALRGDVQVFPVTVEIRLPAP